jgi:hypothetical protein
MKKLTLICALILTSIIALEPFGIVMPTNAQMTAAGVLLGVLMLSIGILWNEKPHDEREEAILDKRGRQALYMGLAVGSTGIAVSAFQHKVEWWLVGTVGSMLLLKLIKK